MSNVLIINGFKIVNLCPHAVDMVHGGVQYRWEKCASPARLAEVITPSFMGGVFTEVKFTDVIGLPDAVTGTLYIVSLPMKLVLSLRSDLVTPTGSVRNSEGQVIGCTSLSFRPEFTDELMDKMATAP